MIFLTVQKRPLWPAFNLLSASLLIKRDGVRIQMKASKTILATGLMGVQLLNNYRIIGGEMLSTAASPSEFSMTSASPTLFPR